MKMGELSRWDSSNAAISPDLQRNRANNWAHENGWKIEPQPAQVCAGRRTTRGDVWRRSQLEAAAAKAAAFLRLVLACVAKDHVCLIHERTYTLWLCS